jgi:maltose O-acetyltransferase
MEPEQEEFQIERPQLVQVEPPHGPREWCRHIALGVLSYLTNAVVNRIPAFWIRHAWYRHVLGLDIGPGAHLYLGCHLIFYGPGHVRRAKPHTRIGRNTIINRGCTIDFRGTVEIGDNVSISPQVAILTAQHRYNTVDFEVEHRGVVIGNNVWIGMRAMVLPGAQIGDGAVVAAGAVVTGKVAALTVVAGVPARPVAMRDRQAARYVFGGPPMLFE